MDCPIVTRGAMVLLAKKLLRMMMVIFAGSFIVGVSTTRLWAGHTKSIVSFSEVFLNPVSTMYPGNNVIVLVASQTRATMTTVLLSFGWLVVLNWILANGFAKNTAIRAVQDQDRFWGGVHFAMGLAIITSVPAFLWAYALDGIGSLRQNPLLTSVAVVLGSGMVPRICGVQVAKIRERSFSPSFDAIVVSNPRLLRASEGKRFLVRSTRITRFEELGSIAPGLVGASLVVEVTLGLSGLARLLLNALLNNDLAIVVWSTIALLLLSELVEVTRQVAAIAKGFHRV